MIKWILTMNAHEGGATLIHLLKWYFILIDKNGENISVDDTKDTHLSFMVSTFSKKRNLSKKRVLSFSILFYDNTDYMKLITNMLESEILKIVTSNSGLGKMSEKC